MQIFTVICNDILYQEARKYFLSLGRSDFLDKSKLSLCGRFFIAQKMAELGYFNFVPEDGIYFYDKRFYSTSYSDTQIFLAISQTKIAVDVEKIIERDSSLLALVSTIPNWSLWESFYLQRTAKECLIKYLNLTQSEMSEMLFLSAEQSKNSIFGNLSWKVCFSFRGEKYEIYSNFEGDYLYSLIG